MDCYLSLGDRFDASLKKHLLFFDAAKKKRNQHKEELPGQRRIGNAQLDRYSNMRKEFVEDGSLSWFLLRGPLVLGALTDLAWVFDKDFFDPTVLTGGRSQNWENDFFETQTWLDACHEVTKQEPKVCWLFGFSGFCACVHSCVTELSLLTNR